MQYSYPEPWSITPSVAPAIAGLGLEQNVVQLRDEGYTIVENAYSPDFCARLREAILRVTREEGGHYFDIKPGEGISAYHLLGADDLFAEALLNPKLSALSEYLCGGDYLLSQIAASVRFSGASAMGLHVDAQWVPPTDYNPLFTACLALDDLTEAAGTTKVIPGSHKFMRNPDDAEAAAAVGAVPIACKAGSFAIWTGYSWHSNYPRTLPGERVMLHMTFCRLAYKPAEDYSALGDEFLAKWPPAIATMLGRNSWLGVAGRNGGACDMTQYSRMWSAARS
ncbi:phytanoyl-CoA dioxygenase family protein [Sphingopyxis sp. OPL5]|uniref:phytanoyl-CoA dioxygenase family protein n=1 Tax=Sphingopyxis sp. OPL5 TaxID=2486273 RepID=UPI00164D0891|nr:phytanoyl-CoA dioxygenase family protein [Sphingopyxis sp. OPL5]QNO27946.1 phytanoyl-CoA dioxygenase family protein [Sphingopyxis sp. OPL5]